MQHYKMQLPSTVWWRNDCEELRPKRQEKLFLSTKKKEKQRSVEWSGVWQHTNIGAWDAEEAATTSNMQGTQYAAAFRGRMTRLSRAHANATRNVGFWVSRKMEATQHRAAGSAAAKYEAVKT